MTKQQWPQHVSDTENAEYLQKIKVKHIQRAVFERRDPFYESVDNQWDLSLSLLIDNRDISVCSSDKAFREKIEKQLSDSCDFIYETKVPLQIGSYSYRRKQKLTKKIVAAIEPKDIIYAEISSEGAMGDCGSARLYTKNGAFYYANIINDEDGEGGYLALCKLLRDGKDNKSLTYCYGGFGNESYKYKNVIFERIDKDCALSFTAEEEVIVVKPSCRGVYDRIAAAFTQGGITAQTLWLWQRNSDAFSEDEQRLLQHYAQYLETFEGSEVTLDDYINVLTYARFVNNLDSHYDWEDYVNIWRSSLAKYRLRYILEHSKNNAFAGALLSIDIEKTKPGDMFKAVSAAIGEDVSKLFLNCEPEKQASFDIEAKASANYPTVKELPKSEHERIVTQILSMTGAELRGAQSLGFYLANYIMSLDRLELATILPAAFHVLREMPNDDEWYFTKRTYWAAADLVNEAWKIIGEPESPLWFEQQIYDACWPRIGDIWPVKHVGEYRFVKNSGYPNELAEYIFDECLGFLVGLQHLDKLNPELYQYFLNADDSSRPTIRACTVDKRCEKLSDEDALAEYLRFSREYLGWYYPNTKHRAELLFKTLLNGSLERDLWFDTYSNSRRLGIGSYLVELANENYGKILALLGEEDTTNLFYAACSNAEVDMYEPLVEFSKKLANADRGHIKGALAFVKHTIKTTELQRKSLLAMDSKPIRTREASKKTLELSVEDIEQLRVAAGLALEHRCMSTAMLQRNLCIGYGRALHLLECLEKLEIVKKSQGKNRPYAVTITNIKEFEEIISKNVK